MLEVEIKVSVGKERSSSMQLPAKRALDVKFKQEVIFVQNIDKELTMDMSSRLIDF